MSRLKAIVSSLRSQPTYVLMRIAARFSLLRTLVVGLRNWIQARSLKSFIHSCRSRKSESRFQYLDVNQFSQTLHSSGVAHGLTLSSEHVSAIVEWTSNQVCYADRETTLGFKPSQKHLVERKLGKPILLAQYFNTSTECSAIRQLVHDPVLQEIAARYLGSPPKFVGANLWWTFPVQATAADRSKHAHLFHRDVDDFRFIKFFFYLTDVDASDGAHVCVIGSHRNPPRIRPLDQWNLRRFTDAEIAGYYPPEKIQEIVGPAGTGFGEDTLCIHKGSTPTKHARLLLQLQFALFDYGAMHDRRDPSTLLNVV